MLAFAMLFRNHRRSAASDYIQYNCECECFRDESEYEFLRRAKFRVLNARTITWLSAPSATVPQAFHSMQAAFVARKMTTE